MQPKLLQKIIIDYAGQGAENLVDLLYNKKNVNEFLIAKKLELTINQTRNILYKLADSGLVTFIRKKDKKKGGWYTYFWTLKTRRSLEKYKDKLKIELEQLQNQRDNRETKRFFYCKNCEIEYNEENALLNEYTCPECGETLEMSEKKELLEHLNDELKKLKSTIKEINDELEIIKVKDLRSKNRRLKAEKKKKDMERAKRRIERAALKKKEIEAEMKKSPSKKKKIASKKPKKKSSSKKKKKTSKKKK